MSSVSAVYEGKTFEFPEGTTQDQIVSFLRNNPSLIKGEEPTRKTGVLEDIKIGAENFIHSGSTASQMVGGGLASLVGQTDKADAIYKDMEARKKAREEELKKVDQGFSGKAISALTGIVPMLAAAPITGPIAAGLGFATMGGLDTAQENLQQGATLPQAASQFAVQTGTDAAANLLPIGKGLLKGAGIGAGSNVVSQGVQDLTGNALMSGVSPEITARYHAGMDAQTAEKYALQGLTGALPGAVFGRMNRQGRMDSPHDLTPDSVKNLLTKGTTDTGDGRGTRLPPDQATIDAEIKRIEDMKLKQELPIEAAKAREEVARLEQMTRDIVAEEGENGISLRMKHDLLVAKRKAEEAETRLKESGFAEDKPLEVQPNKDGVTGEPIRNPVAEQDLDVALAEANREGSSVRSSMESDTQGVQKAGDINQTVVQKMQERAGDIPIEDGLVKVRNDGTEVGATTVRDADGKPVKIRVNLEVLKKQFDEKVWTTSKVDGVEPLPADAFKTVNDWVEFVLQHEIEHTKSPKPDWMSRGEYEQSINEDALNFIKNENEALDSASVAATKEAMPKTTDAGSEAPPKPPADKSPMQVEAKASAPFAKNVGKVIENSIDAPVPSFLDTIKAVVENPDKDRGILGRTGLRAAYEWFGKLQFKEFVADKPLLQHVYQVLNRGEYYKAELTRMALDGTPYTDRDTKGLPSKHVTLSHVNNDKSVRNLLGKSKPKEIVNVMRLFEDGYAKGQEYEVTLQKAVEEGKISAHEQDMFKSLSDMFTMLRDYSNEKVRTAIKDTTDIQPGYEKSAQDFMDRATKASQIEYKPGWFPAMRKGDYHVIVKAGKDNTPFHIQFFRSEMEAKAWKAKAEKHAKDNKLEYSVDPVLKKEQDDLNITQLMEVLQERFGDEKWADTGLKQIKSSLDIMSKFGQFGSHGEHRTGMSGYEGSKWFVNERNEALDWKNAVFNAAEDYGSILNKRVVSIHTARLMNDKTIAKYAPEQTAYARRLIDNAMSPLKFEALDAAEKAAKTLIDDVVVNVVHKLGATEWYPKVHVVEKVHGLAARLFYISALTTRPAFWVGQLVSSPLALRHLIKDGSSVDALMAAGKGWSKLFRTNDQGFIKAFEWAANNTDTFEPAFRNEINGLAFIDGANTKAAKFMSIITGEMMAGKADSVSRAMTFAMMYEHYKAKGLEGPELYMAAKNGTDSSMIMYNRPNKAPIIQKMGMVGQAVAPLQTFATGQLGNFIGDLKYAANNFKGGKKEYFRSLAPAISTVLVTMISGGLIGAPMVAEYELLRGVLITIGDMFGEDWREKIPSAIKVLLKDDKNRALSHGILSAATGYDIGSTQRWSPVISGALSGDEGMSSMFPAIAFASKIGDSLVTVAKYYITGKATEEDLRKASLSSQFFIGQKAMIDELLFGAADRDMNLGGKRGFAQTEATYKDRVGTAIGSKPLETAIQSQQNRITLEDNRNLLERRTQASDLLADALIHGNDKKFDKVIDIMIDQLQMDKKQIENSIATIFKNKAVPQHVRFMLTSKKLQIPKSHEGKRKLMLGSQFEAEMQ